MYTKPEAESPESKSTLNQTSENTNECLRTEAYRSCWASRPRRAQREAPKEEAAASVCRAAARVCGWRPSSAASRPHHHHHHHHHYPCCCSSWWPLWGRGRDWRTGRQERSSPCGGPRVCAPSRPSYYHRRHHLLLRWGRLRRGRRRRARRHHQTWNQVHLSERWLGS